MLPVLHFDPVLSDLSPSENQRLVIEDIAGDAVSRPVECECDRTLAVVATTASRATITNPVILRCLVMGTPPSSKRSGIPVAVLITNGIIKLSQFVPA